MKGKINGVFANRLKQLREMRGISQAQFAKKINMSQSGVAKRNKRNFWETCKSEPTCEKLAEIADVFGVSLDYLLGRTDNPLTTVSENTPYLEVTPFEREFLDRYRHASEGEQVSACRVLGAEHPAETRLRAKKASS